MGEQEFSTAKIGDKLGITKNSVIGMAHRMKLPGTRVAYHSPWRDGEPRPPRGARAMNAPPPKVTLRPLPSAENVVPMAPTRFNPALLPRAGVGPMRYDFRSTRPVVPVIEKARAPVGRR